MRRMGLVSVAGLAALAGAAPALPGTTAWGPEQESGSGRTETV
jgi:hypothetical protein